MKKQLLTAALLGLAVAGSAQVKIGDNPTVLNPSAVLQLDAPNKAFYINRVALTGTNDNATVPTPQAGFVVYNTATTVGPNAVTPGLYYYNGTMWVSTNAAATTSSLAWLLLGNAGTVDGVNFIGTLDNVPFNIRVNNTKAGRIENVVTGNTSYGIQALNLNNPNLAGNGPGDFNTAFGGMTLSHNTTGGRNMAIGYDALGANTTGDSNSASGFGALQVNTIGNNNTADGAYSLNHNINGAHNTGVGYEALLKQVSDSGNTSVGAYSSYNTMGGSGNTATGFSAFFNNITGDSNTVAGAGAGATNFTGSNNTYMGFQANGLSGVNRWSGAIGSNAFVSGDNQMVLGATDPLLGAQRTRSVFVGINVTDPTQRIDFRNGHLRNRQDVMPTTSVTTSAGTTGVILNTGSSDVRGQIIATGANNASATSIIHVQFTYPCTNVPIVTLTPANETAEFNTWYVLATTTGFDVFYRAPYPGLALTQGPVFNYHVIE
jgi:hypothetical protein